MTDLYYLLSIGVLAGTSIAACVGWWLAQRNYTWAYEGWGRACALQRTWRQEAIERRGKVEADLEASRAEAQDWAKGYLELRRMYLAQYETLTLISSQRRRSAKHARAVQLAKQQALRDATTAQLAGEVLAKARKLRVAA